MAVATLRATHAITGPPQGQNASVRVFTSHGMIVFSFRTRFARPAAPSDVPTEFSLNRQVKRYLREVDASSAEGVTALCMRIARHRNRPLQLVAHSFLEPELSGVWLETAHSDYIFFQRETTPAHQQHIILHELGHIIAGHDSGKAELARLVPHLSADIVRRALCRNGYMSAAEREAEMIATVISARLALGQRMDLTAGDADHPSTMMQVGFDYHPEGL